MKQSSGPKFTAKQALPRPRRVSVKALPEKSVATLAEPDKVGSAAVPDQAPIDTQFLETLLGYNARRVALKAIAVFLEGMQPLGLKPVKFSVLSLIAHNPGITARQLCSVLDIQPPNLVGLVKSLQKRGWIERREHQSDGRAYSLHLTPNGEALLAQAETTVAQLEDSVAAGLSAKEKATLIRLLKKVYVPEAT